MGASTLLKQEPAYSVDSRVTRRTSSAMCGAESSRLLVLQHLTGFLQCSHALSKIHLQHWLWPLPPIVRLDYFDEEERDVHYCPKAKLMKIPLTGRGMHERLLHLVVFPSVYSGQTYATLVLIC